MFQYLQQKKVTTSNSKRNPLEPKPVITSNIQLKVPLTSTSLKNARTSARETIEQHNAENPTKAISVEKEVACSSKASIEQTGSKPNESFRNEKQNATSDKPLVLCSDEEEEGFEDLALDNFINEVEPENSPALHNNNTVNSKEKNVTDLRESLEEEQDPLADESPSLPNREEPQTSKAPNQTISSNEALTSKHGRTLRGKPQSVGPSEDRRSNDESGESSTDSTPDNGRIRTRRKKRKAARKRPTKIRSSSSDSEPTIKKPSRRSLRDFAGDSDDSNLSESSLNSRGAVGDNLSPLECNYNNNFNLYY